MKLLIVGAGAIGQWIGANLLQAGQDVMFVGREKFVQAAQRDGLHVQLPDGVIEMAARGKAAESQQNEHTSQPAALPLRERYWHLQNVAAHESVTSAASNTPLDAILLCVKAYAVEDAMREIERAGVLAPHTLVVCFQNGIGAEETVARFVGNERVIAGTLTSAVSLVGATTVKLERAKGGVGLAPFSVIAEQHENPNPSPNPSPLGRGVLSPLPRGEGLGVGQVTNTFIAAPLLHTKIYEDASALKWSKLLLNLVGNANSAIHLWRVADLLADDVTAKTEMQQLREANAVMRAAGIRAVNLPGAPAKWFALAIQTLPDTLLRWALWRFFVGARGDKWPSFYHDAINKTGRSEVLWLNGAVSEWGRRVNVPTPVNDELTRLVIDAVKQPREASQTREA